ncbi:histidine kinase [uncultured Chitinophaga sp.]|jgi:Putative regulator of cell autolysis|uniref:sensor histidine kinase n=1 Tax=uncultured Chitinophaga sp. TaxID=339340 RepID=UPI002621FBE8|nr:histidine kinase [uncultured Chitinophaga sp.]
MCKKIVQYITLLLLIIIAQPCPAQEFPLIHYTKEDGLPGNMVYQVYRDRTGFLWFATDKGVARYNGIRFETFTTSDGLTDNDVISLFEDHYGRIWLNCFKGNLCYFKDGKIHTANSVFPNLPSNTSHAFGTSLESDSSFTLHFSDKEMFVNIKGNTCRVYYLNKLWGKGPNDLTVAVSKRSPSTYELLTGHGSLLIDTGYNIISTRVRPNNRHRCRVGQEMCYIVSEKAVYKDDQPIYHFKGDEVFDNVNSLYISKTDTFVGTEKGLVINNSAPMLKTSRITDVSQDVNGNYWVSTLNNGVYCFDRRFRETKFYNNCYTGTAQYAFAAEGQLFFTTDDKKLYRFQQGKATRIFDLMQYRGRGKDPVPQPGAIADDQGNFHFIADQDHFIVQNLVADKPTVKRNHLIASPVNQVYRISAVKVICNTPRYIYWLHNGYFILRIDRSKIGTAGSTALEDVFRVSDGQRIYYMAQSDSNDIWFSTGKGMYRMVNDSAVLQASFKNLSLSRFYMLGNYLVGWNNSNRLIICNHFDSRMSVDTLPLQDCIWDRAFQLDNRHLLICTNKQYRILQVTPGAGSPVYELSTVAYPFVPADAERIFSDGHTCYFFKDGNITAVPLTALLQKATPSRLLFTGVSTLQQSYTTGSGHVTIPYGESGNIEVSFTALAFGMTDLSYEYTVSGGGEEGWRPIRNEEINLLSFRPGSYTITIRASSASNVHSIPASLLLTITPPFWTSWWFILLAALCFAALLWWVIHLVTRYFIRKKEQVHASEIKFMKLEYKALNALMNPHFIFNSLNNIQGLVNGDNRQAANQYLVTFADLIRQNMHNASKELITLEKEMELIRNYLRLEKLRFNDWLHYEVDIEEQIDTAGILIPPLLVQPLVENAIRHGLVPRQSADSLLSVHIHEDEEEVLYIDVKDNGAGLTAAPSRPSPYESTGLDSIRKRVTQLKLIHNIDAGFDIFEITGPSGEVQGTLARIIIRRS